MNLRLGKLFLMGLTAFLIMAAIRVKDGTAETAARSSVEGRIESKLNAIARHQINDKAWLSLQLQGTGGEPASLALDGAAGPKTFTKGTIYLYADATKKIDMNGVNLMMRSEINRALGYPVDVKIDWISGVTSAQSAPSARSLAFINFFISLVAGLSAAAIAWLYQRRAEKKAWLATSPEDVQAERPTVALPGQLKSTQVADAVESPSDAQIDSAVDTTSNT